MRRLLPIMTLVALSAVASRAGSITDEARRHLARGDTTRAIRVLEHIDIDKTDDADGVALLGELYRWRGTIRARHRSQEYLERAAQRFPNHPQVLLQLGLTYFARTFYGDAIRMLERALATDPNLCPARYKLGVVHYERWKRVNAYKEDLPAARQWLESAVRCDPTMEDAALRYAQCLYVLGEKDLAAAMCDMFVTRFPDSPKFLLMRGALAYEQKRYAGADSAFRQGLARMDDDDVAAFTGIEYAVGFETLDYYEVARADQQDAMVRGFWTLSDPDPTTEVNERLLEHLYRMYLADLYFSVSKIHQEYTRPQTTGWQTERGQTLIKFGWPEKMRNWIGAGFTDGWVQQWTYRFGAETVAFTFEDKWLTGNLQHTRKSPMPEVGFSNRVTRFDPEAVPVPGTVDVAAFKNDDFSAALCVSMQVNADSMIAGVGSGELSRFHFRTAFFDESWKTESRVADTLSVGDMGILQARRNRVFDVVRVHNMPFDSYHVACTLEDGRGKANAVLRIDSDSRRFIGGDLAVSDLLFLRGGSDGGAAVRRGDRELRPNPWRSYGSGQPVRVYFEIYNLHVLGGESRYRLTYGIYDAPEPEPVGLLDRLVRVVTETVHSNLPNITQTFERNGPTHNEREEIAIDIDSLPGGHYQLVVTVEDTATGSKAETSKVFEKIDTRELASGSQ